MAVYNYVRARWLDGEAPIDDAPPPIAAAIEDWLDSWGPFRARDPIKLRVIPEQRVSLLALRHQSTSAEEPLPLELVHVIAVTERRPSEATGAALQGVFEALYGRPLNASLARLEGIFARLPQAVAATRILGHFASEDHLKRLPWLGFDVSEAPSRDGRGLESGPWATLRGRAPVQVAAALAILLSGLLVGNLLPRLPLARSDGVNGGPPSDPAPATDLRAEVVRLASALEEHEWVHRRELEELRRARAIPRDETEPGPTRARKDARPAVPDSPASPPAPVAKSAPPAVAAPPPTEPSPAPAHRRFQVAVKTARVRAGPSAEERVRGLLARQDPVTVTGERADWLEIQPPPGFRPPTWIHRRLVKAAE